MLSPDQEARSAEIISDFHALYYNDFDNTWEDTTWHGYKILKCPLDLWIYQELLWQLKPDFVIETGTAHGGSALWIASMMDLIGKGAVITIDIEGSEQFPNRPSHPRLRYIKASSVDSLEFSNLKATLSGCVMVILDSDHRMDHVYQELKLYSDLVSCGSYLIVEDGNINGHPVVPEHGPGPTEALEKFLAEDTRFEVDKRQERFKLTFNPGGYLRRK